MFLRSMTKLLVPLFVAPVLLANAGCSDKASQKGVRGPKDGTQKQQRSDLSPESQILIWKKVFDEADSMFDQVWMKLHEKPVLADLSSPFSIVQEAIKSTILRQEQNTKIDCRDHSDRTEFLEFVVSQNAPVVQKIICANKVHVATEGVLISSKVSGNGTKWQLNLNQMQKEVGPIFWNNSGIKHVVCDAVTDANDGIIEKLNCSGVGRDMENDRNEYTVFDRFRYQRSGRRILSVEARVVNISTKKEIKKSLNLEIKGDANLEITLPEFDEPDIQTLERLTPPVTPQTSENPGVEAIPVQTEEATPTAPTADADPATPAHVASPQAHKAAQLSPEQLAADQEMDKVIEEYCSEEELTYVKKHVQSKAEIADSCYTGEIVRQEIDVDQLPSTR